MPIGLNDIVNAKQQTEVLAPADMTKLFWVIAGDKQVGKSTFASRFPAPFYLDYEHRLDSISTLDGTRPPQHKIYTWAEGEEWLNAFIKTTPEETGIETVIIDGGGVAYRLLGEEILGTSTKKAQHLNDQDMGYAHGWETARNRYLKWWMNLRRLKDAGYGIVVTTHDRIVPFSNGGSEMDKKVPGIANDKDEKYGWTAVKPFSDVVLHVSKVRTKEGIIHTAQVRGNDLVEAGFPSRPDGSLMPDQLPFSFPAFRDAWDQTGDFAPAT